MRNRTWIEPTVVSSLTTDVYRNSDSVWLSDYQSTYQRYHNIEMNDIVTADFHKLRSQGSIINNPMDRTEVEEDGVPCTHDCVNTSTDRYYSGLYWPAVADMGGYKALSYDETDLVSQATTQVWANVSNSKAAALVTVAEGHKSVIGIKDILTRLLKIIRAAKKLQYQVLLKELKPKEIANRWLEIRYGVRPLIYDAKQIVDALQTKVQQKGTRQTFRGYKADSAHSSDTVSSTWASTYTNDIHRYSDIDVKVRSGVLCTLERVSTLDTWGIFDLPQAAWDLTMFSFVVDWFLNVGDTIAAWTPSASWKALASWVVVEKTLIQSVVTGPQTWSQPYVSGGLFDGSYTLKTITKERIPSPSRPILPSFNVNLDVYKLIDIVALCRSLYTSIRRLRV